MIPVNQKKTIAAVMASLIFFTAGFPLANADELSEKREQAEEMLKKKNEAQDRVDSFSEQVRVLQEEFDTADAEYKEVRSRLDEAQALVDENQALLDKTERDLDVKGKQLNKRVRNIYINGQISYLDVLFGAKDVSDFLTRMDLLSHIIKQDYNLIMEVRAARETLAEARRELDKNKEAAAVLVAEAEEKKEAVAARKQEKDELLAQAEYDRDTSEQAYEELMAASREIERMLKARGSSGSYGGGGMIWPLDGVVTSEFGWRVHPIFGTSRFHSGLDIGGDYGQSILAAAGGTVTYAGWISGYGNAVIIDHGGGITSLYGHCQSLAVGVGESVNRGDVIAYCGSTGNSTGPHCHFEVRQNGEPVSPYGFM